MIDNNNSVMFTQLQAQITRVRHHSH